VTCPTRTAKAAVCASFRTDFEFTHAVDYAGLGQDVLTPFSDSFYLTDGFRTGWQSMPSLQSSLPAGAVPDCSPMVGSDYS
jgi:hypothetical protein